MASSNSSTSIGEKLSREDARTVEPGSRYRLDWRRRSKEELLEEELVPLVPDLSKHDVNGSSSLSPAAVVKLVKHLEEFEGE